MRHVTRLRSLLAVASLGAILAAVPQTASAADVRVLDTHGRVLTVGAFVLVPTDGGITVRRMYTTWGGRADGA